MTATFSHTAREIAGKYVPEPAVRRALDAVGARADQPIDALDGERRIALVSQFVRALHGVGVHESTRIEHELGRAVGADPTGRRPVVIKDAISLITVRNHVHQLATAIGLSWAAGMALQSAVSEVARHVATNGGGRIETEATLDGRIHFDVTAARDLGPVSVDARAPLPSWLIGVSKLAQGLRSASESSGTRIQFWIMSTAGEHPQASGSGAMVA